MGWWSTEIVGGDQPADVYDAMMGQALGYGRDDAPRPFKYDPETQQAIRDKSGAVQNWALGHGGGSETERARAVSFLTATVARALAIDTDPGTDAHALAYVEAHSDGRPEAARLAKASLAAGTMTFAQLREVLSPFWDDPALRAMAHSSLSNILLDKGPGLTVDDVISHLQVRREMAARQFSPWQEGAEYRNAARLSWQEENHVFAVQVAAAVLLSVGAELRPEFVAAVDAAVLEDAYPVPEEPERMSRMRHLAESAHRHAGGGHPVDFSDEGLGAAFERSDKPAGTTFIKL